MADETTIPNFDAIGTIVDDERKKDRTVDLSLSKTIDFLRKSGVLIAT